MGKCVIKCWWNSKLIPLSASIPFFPEDCLYRWHWIEESISVLSLLNQKWSEIATPSLIFILNSTFLSCKLCLIFFFLHIPCSQFFVLTIGLLFCFLPECINNCICRCFILCDLISFPPSPFTCSVFFFPEHKCWNITHHRLETGLKEIKLYSVLCYICRYKSYQIV